MREQITKESYQKQLDASLLTQLETLRSRARIILSILDAGGLTDCFAYGSLARGDISLKSDVDIYVNISSSFLLEYILLDQGEIIDERLLTQATPNHTPKGILKLRDTFKTTITFPLIPLRSREEEFYNFGGKINLQELQNNSYKTGVNKKLQFVQKIDNVLNFTYIEGMEHMYAKKLGISLELVQERVRVLLRRHKIGRTGMFLVERLNRDEQFEQVLQQLANEKPAIRRFLKRYG